MQTNLNGTKRTSGETEVEGLLHPHVIISLLSPNYNPVGLLLLSCWDSCHF